MGMRVNGTTGFIIDFQYPERPANQLREALESDIAARMLPMRVGTVESVAFDGKEFTQFMIYFTDSDNICRIAFVEKAYGYDTKFDGHNNPSFTMAFKDPDSVQDMIVLLTSVLRYLSPGLSLDEAARLAGDQDSTMGTDGYAMPQDIGGYQVQARYTNPHVFFAAPGFDAKMGVTVRALAQLWNGATHPPQAATALITTEDYDLLYPGQFEGEEYPDIVYADFIVKNTWQKQSCLHGETWVNVDVEAADGRQYTLSLDTWRYPNAYEFGVGQLYTLYIGTHRYNGGILYAVQRSESGAFNARGLVQPIDYPVVDWDNPLRRIEPEGVGTVYDVRFVLQSQSYGDWFAALEGHGVGAAQWPPDPEWEGYAFIGWHDQEGWEHTKDTPIYRDTTLFAKWKYNGPGGAWPRPYRGIIQGIDEGGSYVIGQSINMTAMGYNMNLEQPKDQRFRWFSIRWMMADGPGGDFTSGQPFQSALPLNHKGEQRLDVVYMEEVFNGDDWQPTGQVHEVSEVSFHVR